MAFYQGLCGAVPCRRAVSCEDRFNQRQAGDPAQRHARPGGKMHACVRPGEG